MMIKSRLNIIAGVLMIVFAIVQILNTVYAQTLISYLDVVFFILYCLVFSKKSAGTIVYMIAFATAAVLTVRFLPVLFSSDLMRYAAGWFALLQNVALLAFAAMAIVGKFKMSKGLFISGLVALCIYAVRDIISVVSLLSNLEITIYNYAGMYPRVLLRILYDVVGVFYAAAMFCIWFYEKKLAGAKAMVEKGKSIEEELAAVEEAYQAGQISEEEYTEKRATVIDRL